MIYNLRVLNLYFEGQITTLVFADFYSPDEIGKRIQEYFVNSEGELILKNMPSLHSHTFVSRTIRYLSQILQKSVPVPTYGHSDDAAKMKDRITKDKNGQLVTGGIFYCRVSAFFSVSAPNNLLCNLTGQSFEIGNKNIPPIRYM